MLKAARSKSRRDFNSPLAPDTRTIEQSLLLRLIHRGDGGRGGVCGNEQRCVISGPALRSLILLFFFARPHRDLRVSKDSLAPTERKELG